MMGGGQPVPATQTHQPLLQGMYVDIGAVIFQLGFPKGFKSADRTSSPQLSLGRFCWEILVRAISGHVGRWFFPSAAFQGA